MEGFPGKGLQEVIQSGCVGLLMTLGKIEPSRYQPGLQAGASHRSLFFLEMRKHPSLRQIQEREALSLVLWIQDYSLGREGGLV